MSDDTDNNSSGGILDRIEDTVHDKHEALEADVREGREHLEGEAHDKTQDAKDKLQGLADDVKGSLHI